MPKGCLSVESSDQRTINPNYLFGSSEAQNSKKILGCLFVCPFVCLSVCPDSNQWKSHKKIAKIFII